MRCVVAAFVSNAKIEKAHAPRGLYSHSGLCNLWGR